MEKLTPENSKTLEKLGYLYNSTENEIYSCENEVYLLIANCKDFVDVIASIIKLEKEHSFMSGRFDAQWKMRQALGIDNS